MCGILGYTGKKNATPFLVEGIKRLEYRGYDSYGIFVQPDYMHKSTGSIDPEKIGVSISGTTGIGHTRWATVGEVNKVNAHPHQAGTIVVVHNGVVSNYKELKENFNSSLFVSDTDSEVIARLIKKNGVSSILNSIQRVKGEIGAILVTDDCLPNTIWAYSDGSPLIAGVGEDGDYYIASDVRALSGYVRKAYRLNSKELIVFSVGYEIDLEEHMEVEVPDEPVSKSSFDHYMLKEMCEQPLQVDDEPNEFSLPDTQDNIKIIACGSSYYAGLLGKRFLEDIPHIPTSVEYASEVNLNALIPPNTTHIAITQSGETKDTINAIKKLSVDAVSLHNSNNSTITSLCKYNNDINAGPEIGVAATKTFFKTCLRLYHLAEYYKTSKHYTPQLELENLAQRVIRDSNQIHTVAQQIYHYDNFLVLGSGYHYPIALETALKLKEIAYVHAEAMPAAEMKHGPIALIDKNTPSIFFCMSNDPNIAQILQNMDEVKSRKGKVLVFTDCQNIDADWIIELPKHMNFRLQPLISVIGGQLLSYYIALTRGCEIDKPRNLAKSVTV